MNLLKKLIKAKVVYSLACLAPMPVDTTPANAQPTPPAMVVLVPLGEMSLTAYRSVPWQTDSSPFYTSIGVHTNPYIVAVSQDLLKSKRVHYGDLVYIQNVGFKHIADCMNRRHKNSFDVWVETKAQERRIGIRRAQVWLVKERA